MTLAVLVRVGEGGHQKLLIVGDPAMVARSTPFQPHDIRLTRGHTERGMRGLLVDLVGLLTQVFVEIAQLPDSVPLGILRGGHRADGLCGLRVAQQVMNECGVGRAKQALAHGAKVAGHRGASFSYSRSARPDSK